MSYSMTRAGGLRMTPGRIATLAIGLPVALSLIGFLSFDFVADLGQASFPVNYSFPVQDHQVLAQVAGNITLEQSQSSGGTADLKGTADYSLFRPTVTESGSSVGFHCTFQFGNCSLDATLEVPAQSAVSLYSGGGDVSFGSYTGDLTLNTDGGNVTAGDVSGSLSVYSGGGDVSANSIDDPSGQLQMNTDGGNINVQTMIAPSMNIQSGGGDVSLALTDVPNDLTLNTDGGNVYLVVPRGQYDVEANTDGGNINQVPTDAGSTHHIIVNSGGGDVYISGPN